MDQGQLVSGIIPVSLSDYDIDIPEDTLAKSTDAPSTRHWNGNQMCVIDVETNGHEPGYHEIIQLCVLPLDANLNPRQDVIPFYIYIKPEFPERTSPEAMRRNKLNIAKIMDQGLTWDHAADLLLDWLEGLKLPYATMNRKQVIPMGHNYCNFDILFMRAWLGNSQYSETFHGFCQDTMMIVNYINNAAAFHGIKPPYPKLVLKNIALALGINVDEEGLHDSLYDCLLTSKVYKKLIFRKFLYL